MDNESVVLWPSSVVASQHHPSTKCAFLPFTIKVFRRLSDGTDWFDSEESCVAETWTAFSGLTVGHYEAHSPSYRVQSSSIACKTQP